MQLIEERKAGGMDNPKDKRPRFRQAVEEFMEDRTIDGYAQMANDFVRAGYKEKMYPEKIRGWVSLNDGVSQVFTMWLAKTYNLTLHEQQALMEALRRDAFRPPR